MIPVNVWENTVNKGCIVAKLTKSKMFFFKTILPQTRHKDKCAICIKNNYNTIHIVRLTCGLNGVNMKTQGNVMHICSKVLKNEG